MLHGRIYLAAAERSGREQYREILFKKEMFLCVEKQQ